jgi:hypothetical protein
VKDPERLTATGSEAATSGSEESRRLLRAAREVRVPARAQEDVRRAVEARIARPPRRSWRLALGAAGALVAATAAAQGLGLLDRLWARHEAAPVIRTRAPAVRGPAAVELPAPSLPAPAPARRPAAPHSIARPRAEATPGPTAIQQPSLDLPTWRHGLAPELPPRAPAPPALVIARAGRSEIRLAVNGDTIRGDVRGMAVALTVGPHGLTGRLGGDAVLIHLFGKREASGHVGGREVAFTLTPTDHGWIAAVRLEDAAGRVELDPARLIVAPGCDQPLAAQGEAYAGRCGDGTEMRVQLPPAFLALPPLSRLLVLAILLPEPEREPDGTPGLLPPVTR